MIITEEIIEAFTLGLLVGYTLCMIITLIVERIDK